MKTATMMMKTTAVTASPKVALAWFVKVLDVSYSSKDGYPWYPISAGGQVGGGASGSVLMCRPCAAAQHTLCARDPSHVKICGISELASFVSSFNWVYLWNLLT